MAEEIPSQKKILLQTEKSSLWSIPNFIEDVYNEIKDIPLVKEPPIVVRGKTCRQRRDVGFYSDTSTGYRYSGQVTSVFSLKDVPILCEIIQLVNQELGTTFNGILINKYKNGEKYISAHSDSETGLDKKNKTVASIAFGPGIRKFRIRERCKASPELLKTSTNPIVLDYEHQPCELLVMDGEFQKEFTHEIPTQKKIKEERISLTFRHHVM